MALLYYLLAQLELPPFSVPLRRVNHVDDNVFCWAIYIYMEIRSVMTKYRRSCDRILHRVVVIVLFSFFFCGSLVNVIWNTCTVYFVNLSKYTPVGSSVMFLSLFFFLPNLLAV